MSSGTDYYSEASATNNPGNIRDFQYAFKNAIACQISAKASWHFNNHPETAKQIPDGIEYRIASNWVSNFLVSNKMERTLFTLSLETNGYVQHQPKKLPVSIPLKLPPTEREFEQIVKNFRPECTKNDPPPPYHRRHYHEDSEEHVTTPQDLVISQDPEPIGHHHHRHHRSDGHHSSRATSQRVGTERTDKSSYKTDSQVKSRGVVDIQSSQQQDLRSYTSSQNKSSLPAKSSYKSSSKQTDRKSALQKQKLTFQDRINKLLELPERVDRAAQPDSEISPNIRNPGSVHSLEEEYLIKQQTPDISNLATFNDVTVSNYQTKSDKNSVSTKKSDNKVEDKSASSSKSASTNSSKPPSVSSKKSSGSSLPPSIHSKHSSVAQEEKKEENIEEEEEEEDFIEEEEVVVYSYE
ncbi:hypothetical protein TVAG_477710 [Trichomonas vaginalis G3]|uniref:Uncharacterized protein n=1 Tax=Trichomonas vaginalis (strain ATCC PRA-98 / G3) TaxID=412133 RepID=A2G245_TRIV3|nr:hypothetical protein TVAGG3_0374950 [Trichomonas vaginalis G3]EAX88768.1 hypothetical protein TVAG_477710 [Trichomonas vaginalis G3]KAI5532874.1 hypothetical protein TVAGG3_0374950 [Trichomonas vaginalis G3]|eukprot:XP_001301698.1 hypothetical protein [Trichomonas vaginalis G3]